MERETFVFSYSVFLDLKRETEAVGVYRRLLHKVAVVPRVADEVGQAAGRPADQHGAS